MLFDLDFFAGSSEGGEGRFCGIVALDAAGGTVGDFVCLASEVGGGASFDAAVELVEAAVVASAIEAVALPNESCVCLSFGVRLLLLADDESDAAPESRRAKTGLSDVLVDGGDLLVLPLPTGGAALEARSEPMCPALRSLAPGTEDGGCGKPACTGEDGLDTTPVESDPMSRGANCPSDEGGTVRTDGKGRADDSLGAAASCGTLEGLVAVGKRGGGGMVAERLRMAGLATSAS